jgi:hypothetical protein
VVGADGEIGQMLQYSIPKYLTYVPAISLKLHESPADLTPEKATSCPAKQGPAGPKVQAPCTGGVPTPISMAHFFITSPTPTLQASNMSLPGFVVETGPGIVVPTGGMAEAGGIVVPIGCMVVASGMPVPPGGPTVGNGLVELVTGQILQTRIGEYCIMEAFGLGASQCNNVTLEAFGLGFQKSS